MQRHCQRLRRITGLIRCRAAVAGSEFWIHLRELQCLPRFRVLVTRHAAGAAPKQPGIVQLLRIKSSDAGFVANKPLHRQIVRPQVRKGLGVRQGSDKFKAQLCILQRSAQRHPLLQLGLTIEPQIHHVLNLLQRHSPTKVALDARQRVVPSQAEEDDHHHLALAVIPKVVGAPIGQRFIGRRQAGGPHHLVVAPVQLGGARHDDTGRGVVGDCNGESGEIVCIAREEPRPSALCPVPKTIKGGEA